MSIKTIPIPTRYHWAARQLHALLSGSIPVDWSLAFTPTRIGNSPSILAPRVTIKRAALASDARSSVARSGVPTWLKQLFELSVSAIPLPPINDILTGRTALDLGDTDLRLTSSLAGQSLTSTQITRDGRGSTLPLPFIDIELSGLPDPTAHGLTALKSDPAFLLHCTARITRAIFDVRLVFEGG